MIEVIVPDGHRSPVSGKLGRREEDPVEIPLDGERAHKGPFSEGHPSRSYRESYVTYVHGEQTMEGEDSLGDS